MAILNNSNAISSGSYDINNSLRFRASASAYLNRTPASAGNRKTWTWSAWVKRGTLGSFQTLFCAGPSDAVSPFETRFRFNDTDTLSLAINGNGATGGSATTSAVFRDPSAWYHIVGYVDMAATGQANKVRIYVNGVLQTVTYSILTTTDDTQVNNNVIHRISANSFALSGYFDGYMAEQYLIDGQALTPSSFGETDTTTGSWKPKAYSGTYGTNGFYLKFSDIATTSGSNAGLGKDFSGNTNYWTTNNISVTAGTTYDAMIDSPTLTSATVANYAVWNPLKTYSANFTITNGNLTASDTSSSVSTRIASMAIPTSGKYYFEVTATTISASLGYVGVVDAATANGNAAFQNKGAYRSGGELYNLAGFIGTASSYTSGDVIGVAVDVTAGTVQFYKNNVAQGSTPSFTFTAGTELYPYIAADNNPGTKTFNANFGQRPFSYTPPTGFNRLNTFNLPDSTIKKGNTVMDATLYTGNGAARSITNAGSFSPDLVWMKRRNSVSNNYLQDTVRGALNSLFSDQTLAEATQANTLTSFNSNGFSLGTDAGINNNGDTYVAWQWDAGSSTVTNTSGSISSQVRANATAGFSVVTYTGNGTAGATIGHGLGVAPAMVIVKARSAGGANYEWCVQHRSVPATQMLLLSNNIAATTSATFNNQYANSSVVYLGSNTGSNQSTVTYVAYCWAAIAGYSAFGSYTGNGSTNGPFVFTNFQPKYVLIKNTTNYDWHIFDATRNSFNLTNSSLKSNTTGTEFTNNDVSVDLLSNGFKLRGTDLAINGSGNTHIFAAFAEVPTKFSNAR